MSEQEFRDFMHAGLTVEQIALDAGLEHYHRAAFIRFSLDIADEHMPNDLLDYICECGTSVSGQPICMACGQDAHHLCWNYGVVVPGACPCSCYWKSRVKP